MTQRLPQTILDLNAKLLPKNWRLSGKVNDWVLYNFTTDPATDTVLVFECLSDAIKRAEIILHSEGSEDDGSSIQSELGCYLSQS
jgi:hypothetical protein